MSRENSLNYSNCSYDCPVCGVADKIVFRRPALFKPSIINYCCSSCGSKCLVKVIRPKGVNGTQVVIEYKLTERHGPTEGPVPGRSKGF